MAIARRVRKDGITVYDVVEDVGFTREGRRDRKSVTCRTMAEAKREQAKLVAMRDARRNRSGRCTFGQYVEGVWWPSASALAPSSRATYEKELRLRLMPAFRSMDIRDIDRTRIQRMVDGCATEGVARKAVGLLKTILNEAMAEGLILYNPACSRFSMPPKGRTRDNGLVLTTFAAMRPLWRAVDSLGGECVEKLCVTGLLMGMRPEERYGLDWEDFDWAQGTVHVGRAYTPSSRAEGGNVLKCTKTALSDRLLPLPAEAMRRLSRMERGEGPFLPGAYGGRLSPSTAQKRWQAFLRRCAAEGAAVPPVTLENMRHSFATSYLHAGGNVEDLSRILGHSDINTTYRKYVRPAVDDLRRGMDAVVPGCL